MRTLRDSDAFGELHPAVGFLFFALVIWVSMIVSHPVILALSLFSGIFYLSRAFPGKLLPTMRLTVPLALFGAVINPLFSHEGATILTYFPDGNPLTLESIICGISSALTLSAAIVWFSAARLVLTTDKFVWLFGRIAPALSLVFSMTLRFVPRFCDRIRESFAAESLVSGKTSGKPGTAKTAISVISGSVTWAIESSLTAADSMKSRGYGLPGRTAYTNYSLLSRDLRMLIFLGATGIFVLSGQICGGFYWRFYPTVRSVELCAFPVFFALAFFALSLTPAIFDILADRRWR